MNAELRSWASVRQLEYLDAIEKHGSENGAARALGINPRTLQRSIRSLEVTAAQKSATQHQDVNRIPGGFAITGTSTLTKTGDGLQWVKTAADKKQQEAMLREFVTDLMEDVKGKAPTVKPPTMTNADLLAVYPIGDHHHGMYADGDETGGRDYDCKISAHALETAVDYLATLAPPAEDALLINLGDYLHANDSTNETPGHHNRLDVDTRYGRVMHSGALALVHSILRLLRKHKRVFVWNMRGNHDPDAAFALALAISFYFHNEPRVVVDLGASLYKYHRFGQNLLGAHHGHGAKAADLPLIMATDRKQDWGETSFRVWHCGHIHHKTAKEFPGCVVETHRTLPPQDAWAAGKGYRAESDMNAIIYHRAYGEIQRSRFDMSMAL
jgi:molybdenum-dependent DNA-binding transcriptional regulator ModE